MKVDISVSTDGEASALTIKKGKKEVESVLKMLVDIGINLSEVSMESDKVSKPSRYDDDKVYHFEKEISLAATANLAILEEQLTQNEYDVFVSLRNGLTILEIAQKLDFFAKAVAMKR